LRIAGAVKFRGQFRELDEIGAAKHEDLLAKRIVAQFHQFPIRGIAQHLADVSGGTIRLCHFRVQVFQGEFHCGQIAERRERFARHQPIHLFAKPERGAIERRIRRD
jgi:hypothetical protein